MRFEVQIELRNLRRLNRIFEMMKKVLIGSKEHTKLYLLYFYANKTIRFLGDSTLCKMIVALHQDIHPINNCSANNNNRVLVVQFRDPQKAVKMFLNVIEHCQDGESNVKMMLHVFKEDPPKEHYRSLDLRVKDDVVRARVERPQYDSEEVTNHPWINGCTSEHDQKVRMDVQIDHILCILRLLIVDKPTKTREKEAIIEFNLTERRADIYFQTVLHSAKGQISSVILGVPKDEGIYQFRIRTENAAKVEEVLAKVGSNAIIIINQQNQIVFSLQQDNFYECQVLGNEWFFFSGFKPAHMPSQLRQTKLEV